MGFDEDLRTVFTAFFVFIVTPTSYNIGLILPWEISVHAFVAIQFIC